MRTDRTAITRWARWLGTIAGFPLAGEAARVVAGNIDAAGAALVGGLVGGTVLGLVQVVVGGIDVADRIRWIVATGIGFAAGLTAGAGAVGYRTDVASLVVMGAVSGAGVGLVQALSVPMRRSDRVLWAVATPVTWAAGWLITSQVIVDADRQHAVFGLSGALLVSAVAGLLHVLRRPVSQPAPSIVVSTGSAVV
ncbi:MAG: hypothetical protein AB7Q42_07675 [Acidimicrobiia bacterium]